MITPLRNEFLSGSMIYTFVPFILMIPARAKYTSFEKLTNPFKRNVWIPLISLTAFSIFSVLLMKIHPQKFRRIRIQMLGARNQSPILHIFGVIFEGSVHVLPTKNFSRFLLISFILFFMVLRTLYQGGLFTNMQSDIFKSPVSSIGEMLDQHFYFYIAPNILVFTNGSIIDQRYIKIHIANKF